MANPKKETKNTSKPKKISSKKDAKTSAICFMLSSKLESAIVKYAKINHINKSDVVRLATAKFLGI